MFNIDVFYNSDGVLNRNKVTESWIKNNLPSLYSSILDYSLPNSITHFSQKVYHYVYDLNDYPDCHYCHGVNKRYKSFTTGYMDCCTKSCALSLVRPQIEKQRKFNTLEKHGVAHTSMLDSTKDSQRKTNKEIYGYVSPACNVVVKDKMKATNLERYGVEHVMQNEEVKKRYKNNRIEVAINDVKTKYNLDVKSYDGYLFDILCSDCNKIYQCNRYLLYQRIERYNVKSCTKCNVVNGNTSSYEEELFDYTSNLGINSIRNYRLCGKELDIYIPDLNLGIEINGLYWHSELYKTKNYHLDKSMFFEENGINVLHVWEDDWLFRKDIVKSIISNKLNKTENRYYGRKCSIKVITNKESKSFLNENHIQGYVNSKVILALVYNEEIVSVMSFSDKRHIKNDDSYELVRFCNKLNSTVIGGASKLFKYFNDNYDFESLISYAKNDYSNLGNTLYEKLGFEFDSLAKPGYYWCKNQQRYNRYNFRKDKLVSMGHDINKTESVIMRDMGYYKIWDTGNLKFKYTKL